MRWWWFSVSTTHQVRRGTTHSSDRCLREMEATCEVCSITMTRVATHSGARTSVLALDKRTFAARVELSRSREEMVAQRAPRLTATMNGSAPGAPRNLQL